MFLKLTDAVFHIKHRRPSARLNAAAPCPLAPQVDLATADAGRVRMGAAMRKRTD